MTNDNAAPPTSPVPLIPLRRAEEMALEIAALRRRADDEGHGTLAYILDMAFREAKHLAD